MSTGVGDVVLTLDISSTGVRGRAHDVAMGTRGESSVELRTRTDSSGRSVQDFDEICDGVRRVIPEVCPGLRVQAVAASGTASSLGWARRGVAGGLVDVSEQLLWSDTRARQSWEALAEVAADAFPRTLCPPHLSYWPAKVDWARRSFGLGAEVLFAGAKDFVFAWLTGCFWTDPMSAAATGVFDSATWQWDGTLLAALGITSDQVPELHAATESAPLLPSAAAELGLQPGLPVVVGGMDGPLTQLGAAGFGRDIASCTVGTSLAFRANSGERLVDPAGRVWCYPVDRDNWVVGGAANNGGNVLTWIRDRLSPGSDIGALAAAALALDRDPDLQFVPYLFGERAPLWRPELRAAFVGLAPHHTLAAMTRAAIDGVAAALVELAHAVQAVSGPPRGVRLSGGFIREPRWVQLMTDALGTPTAVPRPDSATATGVAILAWAGVRGLRLPEVFTPGTTGARLPDAGAHAAIALGAARLRSTRDVLWPTTGR